MSANNKMPATTDTCDTRATHCDTTQAIGQGGQVPVSQANNKAQLTAQQQQHQAQLTTQTEKPLHYQYVLYAKQHARVT